MRIMGCDLHARQQTVAMLDTDSGELVEKTLQDVIGGRTLLAKPGSYLQHLSESQRPVTALIRHLPIRCNDATNKGHLRSGETCLWAASDLFRSFEVEQTYGQQKKRRPPEEVSNREFRPL